MDVNNPHPIVLEYKLIISGKNASGSISGGTGSAHAVSRNSQPAVPSQPQILYALNELPQPQVDFTFGLENLNPEPSSDST